MKLKSMFNLFTCFMAVIMLFGTITVHGATTTYTLSIADYEVKINGNEYMDTNFPILNYQGRTYAPMRSMLEAAGFKVDFTNGVATVENGGTPTVNKASSAQAAKKDYVLTKADYKVIINGKDYKDENFPILNYEGRTYAPMRSMLEAAGLKVDFTNGVATVEIPKNPANTENLNINDYMTIREIFEFTTLTPSFNRDERTVEIYNDKKELLLVIPKEYTHEFDDKLMVLKSYHESELKPLIDKNKK